MNRNRKTVFRMYSAWNYEKEMEDLNKASEEGWQLLHGGIFSSRFEKNENLCYRYQLDYQPHLKNMGRYLEIYSEQGWEFVNETFNGWYYFRKLYDRDLPEEEYQIFTDRESLQEMNGRWAKIASGILIALVIMFALEVILSIAQPMLPGMILAAVLAAEAIILAYGCWVMRKPDRSKNKRNDGRLLLLLFVVLITGVTANIVLRSLRPDGGSMGAAEYNPIPAAVEDAVEHNAFKVFYPDNYYIDLEITAGNDITFTLLNEENNIVFEQRGRNIKISGEKLYLPRGEYRVVFKAFAGGALDIDYDFN